MNILILLSFSTVALASPSVSREIPDAENCEIELKLYEKCVGALKTDYEEIRNDGHAWKDVNKMKRFVQKMEGLKCGSSIICDQVLMEQHIFESTKHMLKAIYEESSDCIVSLSHDQPKCSVEDFERLKTINELRKNLEILIEHKNEFKRPILHRNFHAASAENQESLGPFVNGKDNSKPDEFETDPAIAIHEEETNVISTQTEEENADKQSVAEAFPDSPQEPIKVSIDREAPSKPENPEIKDEEEVQVEISMPPIILGEESEGSGSEIDLRGNDNETATLRNIDSEKEPEGSVFEITLENAKPPKSKRQPEESEPVDMSSIFIGQPEPEDGEETTNAENAESTQQPEGEETIDMTSIFIGQKEVEEEEAESIPEKTVEVADNNETSIVPPNVPVDISVEHNETQVSSAPHELSVTEVNSEKTGEESERPVKPSQPVSEESQKPGFRGTIKFDVFGNSKNSISFALTPFMTVLALMLLF
ncbi:unnamed protein product [Caenorhabditis brenneri]